MQYNVRSIAVRLNLMRRSIVLGLCGAVLSVQCVAESHSKTLSQAQFDQRIQMYTDQVNATKHILDEENVTVDATEQRRAFCSRLEAYQEIAELAQQNIGLDTANMMLIIANNFLDRQKQSMAQSGMTVGVFCANQAAK